MSQWHENLEGLIDLTLTPSNSTKHEQLCQAMCLIDETLAEVSEKNRQEPLVEVRRETCKQALKKVSQEVLEKLAYALDKPVETVEEEFNAFCDYVCDYDERTALDTNKFPKYMGSNQQLRFGCVVGCQLNLLPVFGALLSPTGGLIGPGNSWFHRWLYVENGILAYHGVAHDAGGHLCSRHKIGPGYRYISFPDTAHENCNKSPLSGQWSGIWYWFKLLDSPIREHRTSQVATLRSDAVGLEHLEAMPVGAMARNWTEMADDDLAIVTKPEGEDGIVLSRAEYLCLVALLGHPSAENVSTDTLERGFTELQENGYISMEGNKCVIDEVLIAMMATVTYPEVTMETNRTSAEEQIFVRHSQIGDFTVEQTYPTLQHQRIAIIPSKEITLDRVDNFLQQVEELATPPPPALETAADMEEMSMLRFSTVITLTKYDEENEIARQKEIHLPAEGDFGVDEDIVPPPAPASPELGLESGHGATFRDMMTQEIETFGFN